MRIWLLILPLLVAGCAATDQHRPPRFLHQVPPGTLLAVERPLHFKAGSLRVYLQDGQLYYGYGFFGRGGVSIYRPYCMLELKQKPSGDLTLPVREFRLDSVRWDVTYQIRDISEFRTEWRLEGGGEPRIHAFVCVKTGNAAHEPHLTLDEIDDVVGDYFRLKAAGGAAMPQ